MHLKNFDLSVATIIAACNVIWALLPDHSSMVGIILGLPLIFVLPGYTLMTVLFHKSFIGPSYRLLLTFGLSLGLDILSGLFLNFFPMGLQMLSWAVLLGGETLLFCLVAMYLRRGIVQQSIPQMQGKHTTISNFLLFGLAVIVVFLSLWYSTFGATQQPRPGFTQLWMLAANQSNNKGCAVRVGIQNLEGEPMKYQLKMKIMESLSNTWPSIELTPQQEWNQVVEIPSGISGSGTVEAQLYRADKTDIVYRSTHITLHGCAT